LVDELKVTVTNLAKKHSGKSGNEEMFSIAKHIYQDDGEILNNGFAIDKENHKILRAKINAMLIDDGKPTNKKRLK
jgi:hypothetical protein